MAVKKDAHHPIKLTSESFELMRAVADCACAVGAATNVEDIGLSLSVLNTARDRLARRLAMLEAEAKVKVWEGNPMVQVKFL